MSIRRRGFLALAGAALLTPRAGLAAPVVNAAAVRRLNLVNAHTGETFSGPYRGVDGPIRSAMADLARFLRDFRANAVTRMDVGVLDFLHDVLDRIGANRATVLSGYRTRATNAMLARTQFGVADLSQHSFGRALDVRPEGALGQAAEVARAMQRGGVGWYPRSGFIHLDSGPPRSWSFDDSNLSTILLAGGPRRAPTLVQRPQSQPLRAPSPTVAQRPDRRQLVSFQQCTGSGAARTCRRPVVMVIRGTR